MPWRYKAAVKRSAWKFTRHDFPTRYVTGMEHSQVAICVRSPFLLFRFRMWDRLWVHMFVDPSRSDAEIIKMVGRRRNALKQERGDRPHRPSAFFGRVATDLLFGMCITYALLPPWGCACCGSASSGPTVVAFAEGGFLATTLQRPPPNIQLWKACNEDPHGPPPRSSAQHSIANRNGSISRGPVAPQCRSPTAPADHTLSHPAAASAAPR